MTLEAKKQEVAPKVQAQAEEVKAPPAKPDTGAAKEAYNKAADQVQDKSKDAREDVTPFFDKNGSFRMDLINDPAFPEFIKSVSNEVLYQIEEKQPGALLAFFATKISDDTYEFNFRGNEIAKSRVGLSWIFKHKPEIRSVSVQFPAEQGGDSRNGVRKGLTGSFFEGDEYLEVLDGYKVTVTKTLDVKKMIEKKDEIMAQFDQDKEDGRFSSLFATLDAEKYKDARAESTPEQLARHVVEVSAENGIDPSLTMSLLQVENGDNGKFFGVMAEGCEGFEMQLEMAVRTIKTYEASYKNISGNDPEKGGTYTTEFLAFFSEIYSPLSAGNTNQFRNLHANYFKYKGVPVPSDVAKDEAKGRELAGSYGKGATNRREARHPVTEEKRNEVLKGGGKITDLVPNSRISSQYGMRNHPILHIRRLHTGLDISAPKGRAVNVWKEGTVTFAGRNRRALGYGNLIIVKHTDGSESYYAHLSAIKVTPGQKVSKGMQIGDVGSTGMSTGPHLHFEVRINGQAVNPQI